MKQLTNKVFKHILKEVVDVLKDVGRFLSACKKYWIVAAAAALSAYALVSVPLFAYLAYGALGTTSCLFIALVARHLWLATVSKHVENGGFANDWKRAHPSVRVAICVLVPLVVFVGAAIIFGGLHAQ